MAVGNPLPFETYAIDAKGVKANGISSTWSFGDGGQAGGGKVTHVYKYAGDYVVVLNGTAGGSDAVSRAEVRVFLPKITMGREDDSAVSLTNDSAYEMNIGGWKIVGVSGIFIISSDTIIGKGKKIIFPKAVTGIDFSTSEGINLLSPDGVIVASFIKTQKPIPLIDGTMPSVEVAEISVPIMKKKIEPMVSVIQEDPVLSPPLVVKTKPQIQTASVALTFPEKPASDVKQTIILKKPEGFFAKIWNFVF